MPLPPSSVVASFRLLLLKFTVSRHILVGLLLLLLSVIAAGQEKPAESQEPFEGYMAAAARVGVLAAVIAHYLLVAYS